MWPSQVDFSALLKPGPWVREAWVAGRRPEASPVRPVASCAFGPSGGLPLMCISHNVQCLSPSIPSNLVIPATVGIRPSAQGMEDEMTLAW